MTPRCKITKDYPIKIQSTLKSSTMTNDIQRPPVVAQVESAFIGMFFQKLNKKNETSMQVSVLGS